MLAAVTQRSGTGHAALFNADLRESVGKLQAGVWAGQELCWDVRSRDAAVQPAGWLSTSWGGAG